MSDENFEFKINELQTKYEQLLENNNKLESDMEYIDNLTNKYYFSNPSEPTKYKVKSLLIELEYFRKNEKNMTNYIEKLNKSHEEEISRLYNKNKSLKGYLNLFRRECYKLDFRNRMKNKKLEEKLELLQEQLAHFMGD